MNYTFKIVQTGFHATVSTIYCQCTGDILDIVDEWQKAEEQKVSHFAAELY